MGRDRYERFSKLFVGDTVDLDEAYEWGLERVAEISAEQEKIAHELYGSDCNVKTAMRKLNQEERYVLEGTDALVEWMQATADKVIKNSTALSSIFRSRSRTSSAASTLRVLVESSTPHRQMISPARAACGGPFRPVRSASTPGRS